MQIRVFQGKLHTFKTNLGLKVVLRKDLVQQFVKLKGLHMNLAENKNLLEKLK